MLEIGNSALTRIRTGVPAAIKVFAGFCLFGLCVIVMGLAVFYRHGPQLHGWWLLLLVVFVWPLWISAEWLFGAHVLNLVGRKVPDAPGRGRLAYKGEILKHAIRRQPRWKTWFYK